MKTSCLFIGLFLLMTFGDLYSQQASGQVFPYIPYRNKNLWGYCDTLGNIKIVPRYDKADFVYGTSHLPVIKNRKKSMLDETGKPMIGFYDNYGPSNFGTGYWVLNNKKAGIITDKGDTALPIIYDKLFYANQVEEYRRERMKLIGKIADQYYLISFAIVFPSKFLAEKITSISPLPKDPSTLWELNPNDVPPETLGAYDPYQNLHLLTTEIQEKTKQLYGIDSVEKSPSLIFDQGEVSVPFYKIYKKDKIGIWSTNHFIYPKYNSIQKGSYYRISFIVELNKKVGIISEEDKVLAPFEYSKIENTYWGPFITTVNKKCGVLMLENPYPNIKNKYDKIKLVQMLTVKSNWLFALFKVEKNGKEGYVGENGIEYFKN